MQHCVFFLHCLMVLGCCCTDTPRYRGMVSELDCWMEWIENQMAEEMYDSPSLDDFEDFIGGEQFFFYYQFINQYAPFLLNTRMFYMTFE